MTISFSVDWLNFRQGPRNSYRWSNTLYPYAHGELSDASPKLGYTQAVSNEAGAIAMRNVQRADMGVFIMYGGKVLNRYAEAEVDFLSLLRWHGTRSDICKRVDLAFDCKDEGLVISELRDLLCAGATKSYGRSYSIIESNDGGQTLYVGKRSSGQFLRIYNKAAEQGVSGDWIRAELELKGSHATEMARMLSTLDFKECTERARSMINSVCDFPHATWKRIMGDLSVGISKAKDNEPDTVAWLLSQVAPAMGKHIAKTGDKDLVERFLEVVALFSDPQEASKLTPGVNSSASIDDIVID